MNFKVLFLFIIGIIFWGCSNQLNMGYYSNVEKNYIFNINAPMVVMYDKNDLLSASYADLVIFQLQTRGFTSVYKQDALPLNQAKIAIYVKLFRTIQAFPNVSYNYSVLSDGLSQTCYWYGDKFYCDPQDGKKTFALTGYSENLNYASSYHFTLDWYDLNLKRRVFYVDGSINGTTCGYQLATRDLIVYTISRIDFVRGEKYQYYIDLPYYWPCN